MSNGPIEVEAQTLADLLSEKLDVIFVGINPSLYSVQRGHYFARSSNRFWPCISRSIVSRAAREALGIQRLGPEHDRALLGYGIGFTDLVKRATARANDLVPSELAAGVGALLAKIGRYEPRVACFHGVTGYRHVQQAITGRAAEVSLGLQQPRLGATLLYVVPNPSGANAHFTRDDQTGWYDRLAECVETSRRCAVSVGDPFGMHTRR